MGTSVNIWGDFEMVPLFVSLHRIQILQYPSKKKVELSRCVSFHDCIIHTLALHQFARYIRFKGTNIAAKAKLPRGLTIPNTPSAHMMIMM